MKERIFIVDFTWSLYDFKKKTQAVARMKNPDRMESHLRQVIRRRYGFTNPSISILKLQEIG